MAKRRKEWPEWWEWELWLWDHVEERMEDRPFAEVDLRRMIKEGKSYKKARRRGRWIIETSHRDQRWEVVVKPDYDAEILEVVTAYPVERRKQ